MGLTETMTDPENPTENDKTDGSASAELRKLRMVQLCDSFFPSGGFTLSHGLESWTQQLESDPTPEEIEAWVTRFLLTEVVPNSAVILLNGHRLMLEESQEEIRALDRFFRSTIGSRERREASLKEGRSVRELISRTLRDESGPIETERESTWNQLHENWGTEGGTFPVTMGLVGAVLSLEDFDVTATFLYSISRAITASAMRLGVLNHFEAQDILTSINGRIPGWFDAIKDRDWTAAGSRAYEFRLLALEHEDADLRLFTT